MILEFQNNKPKISSSAFIAESAIIIGEVEIGDFSSVWFSSILRGDSGKIKVGNYCNIQDACILHEGVTMEDYITLGHRVILHSCVVRSGALIGAGAIIWDDAEIGEQALVGVGSVVPKGSKISSRTLVLGVPAKEIRNLKEEEIMSNKIAAEYYANLSQEYKKIFTLHP